jgi:hypothetical protein
MSQGAVADDGLEPFEVGRQRFDPDRDLWDHCPYDSAGPCQRYAAGWRQGRAEYHKRRRAEARCGSAEPSNQEATMAKQLDESDGRATAGHNVANMHETMNRYFREIHELDVQIDRAKETHVKPLQDQKKEKKKELRDTLDAKEADIKPWYALYKRKQDVQQFEEEDESKKSLDMLRLGYEALREGEQLDYIFALDGDDGDKRQAAE